MIKFLTALNKLLKQPGEKPRLFKYWLVVFSFLIVLPNIGFIIEVLFNQPILGIPERLALVFSLYGNSFRFMLEPVTFSIMVLSVVLALNFLVMRFVRSHNQAAKGRFRSTVTMLIGGHCVACGGSLLAPLASLLAGTGSYFSSVRYLKVQLLTISLNLLAIAIALWSMKRASKTISMILTAPIKLDNTPGGY